MTTSKSTKTVRVGDTVELDPVAGMVRFSDGTVATTRGDYTVRVEGTHEFLDGQGRKLKSVDVKAAK